MTIERGHSFEPGSDAIEASEAGYMKTEEAQRLQLQFANKTSHAANRTSRVVGLWFRAGGLRTVLIPVLALMVYSLAFWYAYSWYRSDESVEPTPLPVVAMTDSVVLEEAHKDQGPAEDQSQPVVSGSPASHPQEAAPAENAGQHAQANGSEISPRTIQPAANVADLPAAPETSEVAPETADMASASETKSAEPTADPGNESVPGPVVFAWQPPVEAASQSEAPGSAPPESEAPERVASESDTSEPEVAMVPAAERSSEANAPARTIPTDSGYILQLAAIKSRDGTRTEWERVQSSFPTLLGDMKLTVEEALVQGKTYFRIQTGPFPTKATAMDLCAQLKEKDQDCLVKRAKL